MIRTVRIPRGVSRMGLIQVDPPVSIGSGGNAGSYFFDPSTGLSKDARLAYYLQDLTPTQLQHALDGKDPSSDLAQLLQADQAGTGLPCGTPESGDPFCNGGQPQNAGLFSSIVPAVPTWAWWAGGGILAIVLLRK